MGYTKVYVSIMSKVKQVKMSGSRVCRNCTMMCPLYLLLFQINWRCSSENDSQIYEWQRIFPNYISRNSFTIPNARCVTPEKDKFLTINMIIHLCSFFKSYPYSATQSREFKILIWLIIFILIHKYWNTNFLVVSKIRLAFFWFSKKINWNKRISHHLF